MNIINDVLVDKLFPDKPKRTKEIPLLEEKSVNGESIIIRDAYPDMPFKGLNVYGKSTQQTTTGAQLFDASYEHNIIDIGNYWGDTRTIVGKNVLEWTSYTDNPNTSRPFYCYPIHPNKEYVITYNNFGIKSNWYIGLADGNGIGTRDLVVFGGKVQTSFISGENDTYLVMNLTNSFELMLNEGSSAKPYEPYTGGKPSPSIEYPQEIMSVGDKGSINVNIDNNGYIQKGTYFDNIRPLPLARGHTYHIERDTKGNNINCFVLNESDKSYFNSANLYDYGYGKKQLVTVNNTGVVDKECRMPMNYENGYTFKVTVDGLYLYQGVNHRNLDTDDFYIGHHANIVDEEYKKQTLTLKTPNGLLGIQVSTGGNYTDVNGQQWVCDEIDLTRGKYVQRVEKVKFDGSADERWKIDLQVKLVYAHIGLELNSKRRYDLNILCNSSKPDTWNNKAICFVNEYKQFSFYCNDIPASVFENDDNFKAWLVEHPLEMVYQIADPIERDLTQEEVETYKALHTNYPTTVIMNDENAGMKVTYLTPSFIPTRESALRIWFKENPII